MGSGPDAPTERETFLIVKTFVRRSVKIIACQFVLVSVNRLVSQGFFTIIRYPIATKLHYIIMLVCMYMCRWVKVRVKVTMQMY